MKAAGCPNVQSSEIPEREPREFFAKVERFCDGDTVILDVSLGLGIHARERVRLIDLDSWELGTIHDAKAKRAAMIATTTFSGAAVRLSLCSRGRDRYGRLRGRILRDGRNIADWMIDQKLAWPSTRGEDRRRMGAAPPPEAVRHPEDIHAESQTQTQETAPA